MDEAMFLIDMQAMESTQKILQDHSIPQQMSVGLRQEIEKNGTLSPK